MKIAFITNPPVQCGVAQFGQNTLYALRTYSQHEFHEFPLAGRDDFEKAFPAIAAADLALYNYHPFTLPFITPYEVGRTKKPAIGLVHEYDYLTAHSAHADIFRYRIVPDPTVVSRTSGLWAVPRIIRQNRIVARNSDETVTTIGTIGFLTPGKDFSELTDFSARHFKKAVLRVHAPSPYYGEKQDEIMKQMDEYLREKCVGKMELIISHEYLSPDGLVNFLAGNDLNAFFYDEQSGRGVSSVIDFAIASERPMVLSNCSMFRHIRHFAPELFLANTPVRQILETGGESCKRLKALWTPEKAARAYDDVFTEVIEDFAIPHTCRHNTVFTDDYRAALAPKEVEMRTLTPDVFSRKIARANVQQAYIMAQVEQYAKPESAILCVGYHEDTAYFALKAKGYAVDAIDPEHDMDLAEFYDAHRAKRYYDVIFSTSVLEHVVDDRAFMRQIADLLAPGGVAFLTVDFKESYVHGERIPGVDARLYTTHRILRELIPCLPGCRLLDTPDWNEYEPDFEYENCRYGFAGIAFQKVAGVPDRLTEYFNWSLQELRLKEQVEYFRTKADSLAKENEALRANCLK